MENPLTIPKFPITEAGIRQAANFVIGQIERDLDKYRFPESERQSTTAIFMAWAPGSGKTEFIQSVLNPERDGFFFIDIDSYRDLFEWYNGDNAREFQQCMSKVVNHVFGYCLENGVRFIMDGTFKSGRHSLQNVDQCRKNGRTSHIYFLYQNPFVSYYYTYLRKLEHKRNVPVDGFVDCFYKSISNVFEAYKSHKSVEVHFVEKTPRYSRKNKGGSPKGYAIYEMAYFGGDIRKFCFRFEISYNPDDKSFPNKDNLRANLEAFDKALKPYAWIIRAYLYLKRELWPKKQSRS